MGVRIKSTRRDDRVEQIIADPEKYYAEARARARAEILEDMERERRGVHDRLIRYAVPAR